MTSNAPLHLIVGLGNPGPKYDRTRHNAGFAAIDELARRHGLDWRGRQARAEIARGTIGGVSVVLAKPQTFMNLSGESVSGLLHWHKLPVARLLVLYDDLDLPLGTIRVRARGSAGGHNGMSSIIQHLRTQEFARVRIGIERPPGGGDPIGWVLGHFTKEQAQELAPALSAAADAAEFWLANGIDKTMNAFNGGAAAGKEPEPQRNSGRGETQPDAATALRPAEPPTPPADAVPAPAARPRRRDRPPARPPRPARTRCASRVWRNRHLAG